MSLSSFVRVARRWVASVCAAMHAVLMVVVLTATGVADSSRGAFWLVGSGAAALLLVLLAAVPRMPIALVWILFLGSAWATALAVGTGALSGLLLVLAGAVAVACVAMAVLACVVHYDIAQSRPVSRL